MCQNPWCSTRVHRDSRLDCGRSFQQVPRCRQRTSSQYIHAREATALTMPDMSCRRPSCSRFLGMWSLMLPLCTLCRSGHRRVPSVCQGPWCSTRVHRNSRLYCGRSFQQVQRCHQGTQSQWSFHVREETALTMPDTSCRRPLSSNLLGMWSLMHLFCTLHQFNKPQCVQLIATISHNSSSRAVSLLPLSPVGWTMRTLSCTASPQSTSLACNVLKTPLHVLLQVIVLLVLIWLL